MRHLLLLMVAVAATFGAKASNEVKPLPNDPEFRVGQLENGLTYYIRQCDKPSGHAEFYIVHNVGSLQEDDNQRGLAHFLEHMAFNGTKNFENKNFLKYFASIGVKFGSNINAYTSKDRTVYNISAVPTERNSVIDSTILALHDWSSFISCGNDEIEAERGVVREEWRRSDDVKTRMMKAIWGFEQQGSKFAARDVIGDINIINTFTRDELIDYYHKWYRPDLQAVIIVGDIDPDYVEQQIKTQFNKIPKAVNPAPRKIYNIEDHQDPTIGYFIDKDAKAASARISVKIPFIDAQKSRSKLYIEDQVMNAVLMNMVKTRYSALSKVKNPKLRAAIPVTSEMNYYGRVITITALPLNNDHNLALKALLEEYERIERYGFSPIEVTKAINAYSMTFKQISNQTLTSADYVDLAIEHYTRNEPLISHETYCELANDFIESLTPEMMNDFTAKVWGDKNRSIIYCGGTKHAELFMPRQDVVDYVKKVKELEMEPFVLAETKGPELRKIDQYATIVSREYIEDFKAEKVVLSNGLEIYWRELKSAHNPIEMSLITKNGVEGSPLEELDALKALNSASSYATIGAMPKAQQDAWLGEQGIMLFNHVNSNHSRLAVAAKSSDKLGTILRLVDNCASSMGFSDKDFLLFKKHKTINLSRGSSEFEEFGIELNKVIYKDPISITEITKEQLDAVDKASVEAAFKRHFSDIENSYLLVLSTISLDDAIDEINKSFSQNNEYNFEQSKTLTPKLEYTKGKKELRLKAKNLASTKAQLGVLYNIPSKYTTKEKVAQEVFCNIFQDRLMALIREEMGATYTVGVSGFIQHAKKPFQTIEISLDTDPKLLDPVFEAIDSTLAELAENGITAAELTNTKLYFDKYNKELDQRGVTFISEMVKYIDSGVDTDSDKVATLQAITINDINKVARRYFKSKNVIKSSFGPEVK